MSSKELRPIFTAGKVRPFVLGVLIMLSGLLLEKWWWKVGGIILIVVFVEAAYRYRTLD